MDKETGGKSKKQLHQALKKEPQKKSRRKRPHTVAAAKAVGVLSGMNCRFLTF